MLDVKLTRLSEVVELTPRRFGDDRGFFSESFNENRFREAGISCAFVQDNHSYSAAPFTLRGLHFQANPFAQDKLVRALRGSIFDVAVDIRNGSPTFGQWVGVTLTAKLGNQLFVPAGFAHGFLTLEPDCEVAYKTSNYYSAENDHNLRYDDPAFKIDWPLENEEPVLSDKDEAAPFLSGAPSPFSYN